MKKRKDGRYQKKILLASGKYKIVYGATLAELNKNVQNIRDQESQGLVVDDNTLVGEWAFQSTPSTRRVTANTNNYITFVHLSIIQSIL